MMRFPRSSTGRASRPGRHPPLVGTACVPSRHGARQAQPGRRSRIGSVMSCGDVQIGPHPRSRSRRIDARCGAGVSEYVPNSIEPSSCWARIRIAGRFVQVNVLVIVCIRFRPRAEASWSTMDREASTIGTAAPGFAGAETCGGVMVRGPKSGDGAETGYKRSPEHSPGQTGQQF